MSKFKFWLKPRCAYVMLLIFVKFSEWEMVVKPTLSSARYYLYMREKDNDLDHLLDVWAYGYAYPQIYDIRRRYDELYSLLDRVEKFNIQWPTR